MSLFVSNSNEILNIGEKAATLLDGLVVEFGDSIIDEVLEFIQSGDPSARLTDVNSSDLDEIKDFFGMLIQRAGGNEAVQILRQTVGDIPDAGFAWTWKDDISHNLPLSGSVTLTLGANASAEAKILPRPSYYFKGQAGVSGSITVPFSYGAFAVRGAAKGSAELQAAFNHPTTTRVLTALANDLPVIANLASPRQLLNGKFSSASLKLQGEVNLGATLTTGRSWVASLGSNGRSSATAEVTAGLKYGIDWARSGQFEVAIQPHGQLLDVTLTEVHKESMRRSLSIGANVKFSGVKQALQPVMDQIAGLPAALEKIAKDYARPGERVKELLGKRLRAADDRIQELAKAITGEGSAESLVDQLVAEALDSVDGRVDGWTALANGEVAGLTPSILDGLNIPQTVRADLEALLNEKLLETSDALGQALKTQITSALQNDAGPEIVDFLNALSLQTTTTLNALNTSATELLKPVNAFLAQYRKFEQSLVDAVEVVEKEELALQFIRTVDKSKERTALLTFALDPSDDRAVALYRQMLVGNFRGAMTAGLDAAQAYITLVDGQFKTVFERKATTGIKINFFDMPLTFQRILTSNLTVENSVGGDISVFDVAGSARAASLAFGEKEETIISSSLSLVGAKNEPDAQGLSIRLRYSDENLTTQEMRDYLTSFTAVGLLAEGAGNRVSDGATTIGIPDDDGDRALKINAQMSLTRGEIEKIATIPEETVMTVAIREQLDALDETPVNRQYLVGILPSDAQLDPRDHDLFTSSTFRISDELKRRGARGLPLQLNYSAHLIHGIGLNAEGLVMFLKSWQDLVAMPFPELDADRQLKASDLSRFDDKNTEMIASLANWAQVAGFIRTSLGEEYVSPWALAFLKTLRALSGKEQEMLPIYVSWNQDGRVRRIAVI